MLAYIPASYHSLPKKKTKISVPHINKKLKGISEISVRFFAVFTKISLQFPCSMYSFEACCLNTSKIEDDINKTGASRTLFIREYCPVTFVP